MATLKWIGNGVFSWKGKDYGHGDTVPDIPKETLESLKKRKLVGSIAQAVPTVPKEQLIPATPASGKDVAGPKKRRLNNAAKKGHDRPPPGPNI